MSFWKVILHKLRTLATVFQLSLTRSISAVSTITPIGIKMNIFSPNVGRHQVRARVRNRGNILAPMASMVEKSTHRILNIRRFLLHSMRMGERLNRPSELRRIQIERTKLILNLINFIFYYYLIYYFQMIKFKVNIIIIN